MEQQQKKLRLVKVFFQPTFVLDDGESLVEHVADPLTISGADWPEYAKTGFDEAIAKAQASIEDERETN